MIARLLDVARDRAGSVLVEFAVVLPVLLVVLLGVLQFGMFYYSYIALTEAAAAGAREFSISRLAASGKPYTDTVSAIKQATCNASNTSCKLQPTNLTITTSVNGTACASDSACQTALTTAHTNRQPASVTVSYACTSLMPVGWVKLGGVCPLTITMTERVQ